MNKIMNTGNDALSAAVAEIGDILEQSRATVAVQVNQALVAAYWKIGEIIVRYEQNDQIRAAYGEKTLRMLSRTLAKEFGRGFSLSNVYNMRQFYVCYPIFQTASGKLSWSHYCELLSISDNDKRRFYEQECVNSAWSAHGGKQLVIDGGHDDDGLDGRAGDGLPDKFGLAHAVGGQALHEVGVFFFGHTGLDDVGAVGRVVAFGQ